MGGGLKMRSQKIVVNARDTTSFLLLASTHMKMLGIEQKRDGQDAHNMPDRAIRIESQ